MNETEKTTVKVTRTVTEQIISNGQLKDMSKIIITNIEKSNENSNTKLDSIINNLINSSSNGVKNLSGTSSENEQFTERQNHEKIKQSEDILITKKKAEEVVNTAVNAAVEKVIDESSNKDLVNSFKNANYFNKNDEETIKIEEESKKSFTTTKILLNLENDKTEFCDKGIESVQKEFYKNGKLEAEELIKSIIKPNL